MQVKDNDAAWYFWWQIAYEKISLERAQSF